LNDKAGTLISKLIQTRLIDATRTVIMNSITTKNDKLYHLSTNKSSQQPRYNVPVINLSTQALHEKELRQLSMGLDHSFVNKNRYIKQNLAANFEAVANKVASSKMTNVNTSMNTLIYLPKKITPTII